MTAKTMLIKITVLEGEVLDSVKPLKHLRALRAIDLINSTITVYLQ